MDGEEVRGPSAAGTNNSFLQSFEQTQRQCPEAAGKYERLVPTMETAEIVRRNPRRESGKRYELKGRHQMGSVCKACNK